MEGGKWREERFVLAPWAVRSVWIRVAGRNLAGERLGGELGLERREGEGMGRERKHTVP
jgi:hypothetical protein